MTQDAARVRLREIADGWKYAYGIDGTVDWANQYADVLIALVREARECFRLIAPNDDWSGFENAQGEPVEQPIMAWLAKVED